MKLVVFSFFFCFAYSFAAFDISQHPSWHLLDHETCGESVTDRIIGGTTATLGQFPWMARLGYIKQFFYSQKPTYKCGGSLINNVYILTAAHCVTELRGESLNVIRLGEHNTLTDLDCEDDVCAPPVQDFKPAQVIYHEKYQQPPMRNDIALIRLDRPVHIDTYVSPICLPRGPLLTRQYIGTTMEVAGWGVSDMKHRRTSPVLLHVRVPIVNRQKCDKTLGKFATVGREQFCAGGEIGYDSCGGDSGGPLMKPESIDGPPKYYLMGVVSFGSVKCGGDAPAVYTDVGKYLMWILDHIEP